MALNFIPLAVAALAAAFGSSSSNTSGRVDPGPGTGASPGTGAGTGTGAGPGTVVSPAAVTAADVERARAELARAEADIEAMRRRAGLAPTPPVRAPAPVVSRPVQRAAAPARRAAAPAGPVTPQQLQGAMAAVRWRLQGGTPAELQAAQQAMGGLNPDGQWGSQTRDRAALILDRTSQRATPEQRAALGASVLILRGTTSGPEWTQVQRGMGMPPEGQTGRLDPATAARAGEILRASGMVQ